MELKKATTFEEQVVLLKKKNIIVTDKESCIDFLSKINYYRLSGYYLPFIKRNEEAYSIPKMPSGEKYIPTRRLFAQLYMLKLMYPNKDTWNDEFLKPLIKLVKKYKPYISLKHMDFPYRWKSMLTYK